MSAVVKLTQENDESCVYVAGYDMESIVLPRERWLQAGGAECRCHGHDFSDGEAHTGQLRVLRLACRCGMPVEGVPSRSRLVTWRARQDTEERVYSMVSLITSSRDKHDKLWRALLSYLSRPADCESWSHDEVDALVSQPAIESDLLRLPREACLEQERWQSGERHSVTQRLNGVWLADRRCPETVTATVKLARVCSKSRR